MRAGALRHLATVYVRSSTPDSFGEYPWEELGKYRCSMKQKYTIERAENGETFSKVRFDMMFRYSTALANLPASAELLVDGKRLQVLTVADPTGKHRSVFMTAEKRE